MDDPCGFALKAGRALACQRVPTILSFILSNALEFTTDHRTKLSATAVSMAFTRSCGPGTVYLHNASASVDSICVRHVRHKGEIVKAILSIRQFLGRLRVSQWGKTSLMDRFEVMSAESMAVRAGLSFEVSVA